MWAFVGTILLAVALAPAILVVFGIVHRAFTQGFSIKDVGVALIGSPIIYATFLAISFVPAFAVTVLAAGAGVAVKRFVPGVQPVLWIAAGGCLAYMWIALSRYPNGDGGTMQSMWESIKATCAASIAAWCVMAART